MAHEKASMFTMIAGAITIFVFLTGIHSIPSILGKASSTSQALFDANLGKAFPATILIISQVAYYLSYYGILRFIHVRFFKNKSLDLVGSPDFFFILVIFILGCGISYAFLEGFWGPLPELVKNDRADIYMPFTLVSLLGNGITVWNGLRCE